MDDQTAPPLPAASQSCPTIGGITRTMDRSQANQSSSIRASVRGQAISWVLFVAALLPPLALVLIDALSGAMRLISYSALWAWGALVLGVVLLARAGLAAGGSARASAVTAFAGPAVLLLVAVLVLYLRLRLVPVPFAVAVAQVVIYAVCAFALLLAPTDDGRPL